MRQIKNSFIREIMFLFITHVLLRIEVYNKMRKPILIIPYSAIYSIKLELNVRLCSFSFLLNTAQYTMTKILKMIS